MTDEDHGFISKEQFLHACKGEIKGDRDHFLRCLYERCRAANYPGSANPLGVALFTSCFQETPF